MATTQIPGVPTTIRYSPHADAVTGHSEEYKLLEISDELLRQVDAADSRGENLRLTIKGKPTDEAVICTSTETFQLRTISLSNSLLVLQSPQSIASSSRFSASSSSFPPSTTTLQSLSTQEKEPPELHLQDTSHEILELIPIAPRLERIDKILKTSRWGGMGESTGSGPGSGLGGMEEVRAGGKRKSAPTEQGDQKRYTRNQLRSVIQASDSEIDHGLRERNVIQTSSGHLLQLTPESLVPLLSIVLSLITIHPAPPSSSSPESQAVKCSPRTERKAISEALVNDYSVQEDIVSGIMGLFGKTDDKVQKKAEVRSEEEEDVWVPDVERIVREMGKGILQDENKDEPGTVAEFLQRWRMEVGDEFGGMVDLEMLKGYHLLEHPRLSTSSDPSTALIIPFSHSTLPPDPATRFNELFLQRTKWRPEDMEPFLRTLGREGDKKSRDKMVGKFVRVVKEREGVWWYPRRMM